MFGPPLWQLQLFFINDLILLIKKKIKVVHHLWLVPFHLSSEDIVGLSGMTILCFSLSFYEYAVLAVLCHLFLCLNA